MTKLSTAIKTALTAISGLAAVTTNVRRVTRRQDMTDDGVYFQDSTKTADGIDSDTIKKTEVTVFVLSNSAGNILAVLEAMDGVFSGKGESGTFLDISTATVHCITTKRMRIEDAEWDTELQRYIGIFQFEAEWSYK